MIQFDTLQQWLEWLEASHPTTDIELGLSRVTSVAKKLNLIKPNVPVITVAGTNGKGSVIATLESLAINNSLKIGSYTSPHLINFNERVKINGVSVSDETLSAAFESIANQKGETKLTYFEFTTLVGLYCFKETSLDFIALEVGLGGRLDAVNIIDSDVAVITSIGLDHTDWLGETLEEIAYEKAGVARSNKPLVVASKGLIPLLGKAIEEINPNLIVESLDYQLGYNDNGWSYSSSKFKLQSIESSSLLETNQAAALSAFCELFPVINDKKLIMKSLKDANLNGRFSTLSKQPFIKLDVAHNPDSARLLNKNISEISQRRSGKVWAICGMLQDKDIATSLAQVSAIDHWLFIDLQPPRGAKAEVLREHLSKNHDIVNINSFADVALAYDYFNKHANESDWLVVFGSFVTVGQMLEYWDRSKLRLN